MKIIKRIIVFVLAATVLAAAFYFLYMLPRYTVPILMYHSIRDNKEDTLSVSPENFARQMGFLRKSGYNVVSLDELVDGIKKAEEFPHNTVVITFDDGLVDNYTNAFPVLSKHGLPATMFLITGYVDEREGYLTWDQVRLMKKSDITFGGHTRTNEYLPGIAKTADLWNEVMGSKFDIEENTESEARYFCYPIGGFNKKVTDAVKRAGYKGACTTNRGPGRTNKDIYRLKRVKVTDSDMTKSLHFRAKLSGYYNLFRSIRKSE